MVTVNVVLNKAFYIAIPYSSLEAGVSGAQQTVAAKGQNQQQVFVENAKKVLASKSDSVMGQLQKFAMSAKVLEKEELIKLFYDTYNEGQKLETEQVGPGVDAAIISGGNK